MPPPRVLLVRAGALGDLLLLRPTIAALQRAGWIAGLLAPSGPAAALVGTGPGDVTEAMAWESAALAPLFDDGALDDAQASARLRAYDVALVYSRNRALALGLGRVVPVVRPHDPEPPADGAHASDWLASCLPAIGVAPDADAVPVLAADTDDQVRAAEIARALPRGFLAVHPGSGSPAKNWPAERFAALVRAAGGTGWLLVRGPADDVSAVALERIPGAVVARDLPLRVLSALLAQAGAYVGNDSGVTHLAAASGAPTVALFGPTDPRLWRPLGPRVTVVRAGRTMESIAVDAVRTAVAAARD